MEVIQESTRPSLPVTDGSLEIVVVKQSLAAVNPSGFRVTLGIAEGGFQSRLTRSRGVSRVGRMPSSGIDELRKQRQLLLDLESFLRECRACFMETEGSVA